MCELCLNGRCHSHLILGFGLVSSQELEAGAGANSGGDDGIGDARGISLELHSRFLRHGRSRASFFSGEKFLIDGWCSSLVVNHGCLRQVSG